MKIKESICQIQGHIWIKKWEGHKRCLICGARATQLLKSVKRSDVKKKDIYWSGGGNYVLVKYWHIIKKPN